MVARHNVSTCPHTYRSTQASNGDPVGCSVGRCSTRSTTHPGEGPDGSHTKPMCAPRKEAEPHEQRLGSARIPVGPPSAGTTPVLQPAIASRDLARFARRRTRLIVVTEVRRDAVEYRRAYLLARPGVTDVRRAVRR